MSIAGQSAPQVEFVFVPRLDLRSLMMVLFETLTSGAPDARDATVVARSGADEGDRIECRDPFRKC